MLAQRVKEAKDLYADVRPKPAFLTGNTDDEWYRFLFGKPLKINSTLITPTFIFGQLRELSMFSDTRKVLSIALTLS